ncbi:MAG: ABC transporter ATP-binding protein [Oscillatoriales cyanobacterium C42_A2020_001]|nr:ABC transporter ATP-binding protein [Leptolyngbyaceae cyanobacterium C42_A2020_001]
MDEVVVSLSNVSKCFKRYAHPADRLKETLLPGKSRAEEFWALREINLQIQKGETFGILGRNGSGKSTLLQIIAGTLTPTTGDVTIKGRISALLELGSGFDPEFSGRQNVFFKGRILGLSQAEIEQKFDQIAAFADIGDFIEQPVKTYSSGMFVRLAFAVAIHVKPELLIVDEALAVGDIFFQQKCFRCLEQLRANGVTIIFVSHDAQAVVKLCDRAVILQNGHLIATGIPSDMVAKYAEIYYSQFLPAEPLMELDTTSNSAVEVLPSSSVAIEAAKATPLQIAPAKPQDFVRDFSNGFRYGCMTGLMTGISLTGLDGKLKTSFLVGEEVLLSIQIREYSSQIYPLNVGFQIKDRMGQILIGTSTCLLDKKVSPTEFGQPFTCQFKFRLSIIPGQYTISPAIAEYKRDAQIIYDWIENALAIDVVSEGWLKQIGLYFPDVEVMMAE